MPRYSGAAVPLVRVVRSTEPSLVGPACSRQAAPWLTSRTSTVPPTRRFWIGKVGVSGGALRAVQPVRAIGSRTGSDDAVVDMFD